MTGRGRVTAAALAFLASASTARAESTICREGALVETGQHEPEVLAHCGNPSWSQSYVVQLRLGSFVVDEWLYPVGYGYFPRLLRFERGVLVRITTLSR
jgi:hypothetical protein